MPAALYSMTLRQGGALGNPILVTQQGDLQTSRQYWSHLLCGECEERFNRNGERYAMTQVDNGQGPFPLFDRLNVAMPREATPEISLYSGRDIGIDPQALSSRKLKRRSSFNGLVAHSRGGLRVEGRHVKEGLQPV
jgi:hypothetical protein